MPYSSVINSSACRFILGNCALNLLAKFQCVEQLRPSSKPVVASINAALHIAAISTPFLYCFSIQLNSAEFSLVFLSNVEGKDGMMMRLVLSMSVIDK